MKIKIAPMNRPTKTSLFNYQMTKKTETIKRPRRVTAQTLDARARFVIDYKNYEELATYLNDRARIIGRKKNGLSPKQQRKLTIAVKRARHLGLLPFRSEY